ncbi:hypothetical protein [Brevibacterium sp. S22]|uniref:hypothetical protein n=1 Tax=Brevibacterium sp. S22 TaxID=2483794 RepID=UPI00109223B6|nr:hypothetical protein [Brevibacterium sp. S22]
MDPQDMSADTRESELALYTYDESTASAEVAGELGSDTPFCYKANQEGVEGSDPTSESDYDIPLYPVSMPDSDSVYIEGDMAEGIAFEKEEKQLDGVSMVIPEELADIDSAIDNVADDQVEYCDLQGSLCGG